MLVWTQLRLYCRWTAGFATQPAQLLGSVVTVSHCKSHLTDCSLGGAHGPVEFVPLCVLEHNYLDSAAPRYRVNQII